MAKKKTTKKSKRQRWDEHLVIAVMVVAAACVLIIIASFVTVTGKATHYGTPTTENIVDLLNKNTQAFSGNSRVICKSGCAYINSYAVLSYKDGVGVENTQPFSGDFNCLCIKE